MQMLRIVPDGALSWRDAFLALALVAALIRSLLPAGFMPASDETGAVRMVICTVGGAKTLDGAARAPTEKMPAPTATATPRIIRSQTLSERFSWRPGSSASARVCSIDLVRKRLIGG